MFGHGYMKDKISTVNRSKHNDNLTFRMFQNVLSKIVQFTNDIMKAVNHVLFKQLIFISVEICCIICPFIPRQRKRRKKKKKRSIHLYLLQRKKKIINSCILKLARRPAPLLFIIISVCIFPLVYSSSFILRSVQHYIRPF